MIFKIINIINISRLALSPEKITTKAIKENSSDALFKMTTNIDENSIDKLVSNRICKEGEDEVFDNCVLGEVKREWNEADQGDIKDNNKNASNKEFGDAAMELIAKVNKKIDDDLRMWTASRLADVRDSRDGQEGMGAFLEKRQPSWTNVEL